MHLGLLEILFIFTNYFYGVQRINDLWKISHFVAGSIPDSVIGIFH